MNTEYNRKAVQEIMQYSTNKDTNYRLIGKLAVIVERQNKKIVELESKINLLTQLNEANEKSIKTLNRITDVNECWT